VTDLQQLQELEQSLQALHDRKLYHKLEFFKPYPKQLEFFANGRTHRERLLSAGNQQGKTEAGSAETAYHLTGLYPEWWPGRKFRKPVRAWVDGETGVLVRDAPQRKLFGEPGVEAALGTGYIPKDCIVERPSLARGVTDAFDTGQVKHFRPDGTCDGVSTVTFKSYEQGRQKHQSEAIDFCWMDEEPPQDIYSEVLTRTNATGGFVYTTFTPLNGMTDVARKFFMPDPSDPGAAQRVLTQMTIDDAQHIPLEEREKIIASYAAHEREARVRGVPMLGEGKVFQVSEESIWEDAIPAERIPFYWTKLWAIDFGINHAFAAVLLLWDRENDVLHVHHAFKLKDQFPLQHTVQMKRIGAEVPCAWPHDGNQRREASNGETTTLAKQYKTYGVRMLPTHATFPDGGFSTEAGIMEMQERFRTGRLKVAKHLTEWFEEFRLYHRKDGLIVKINDDLMSATRIGVMAKRFSKAVALGPNSNQGARMAPQVARDVDFDVFG
jgi:phage terminase large subunit-like protein